MREEGVVANWRMQLGIAEQVQSADELWQFEQDRGEGGASEGEAGSLMEPKSA